LCVWPSWCDRRNLNRHGRSNLCVWIPWRGYRDLNHEFVCVWVSWCEHPNLNRRFLLDLCVYHLVRASEFEPSVGVVSLFCECAPAYPHTPELMWPLNEAGMLVSKLTDLVAEINSRIVTPNCVPEVHSQGSPSVTDSS
jgi:hypothetical protein